MSNLTKLYSTEEASLHNTKDDCWIVVDGKVYDVTTYLDEHPGGDDVVLETTGRDATDDFEDAGHSKDARELLETFYIGKIDNSSSSSSTSSKKQSAIDVQKIGELTKQYWVVPLAVLGISVIVGFLYLHKKNK